MKNTRRLLLSTAALAALMGLGSAAAIVKTALSVQGTTIRKENTDAGDIYYV